MTPQEAIDYHRHALAIAAGVVGSVRAEQMVLPTPCTEWNVRQVIAHMIGGNLRIGGQPPDPGADVVGDDPAAAYAASAELAKAAFEAPDGLDRTYKLLIGEIAGHAAIRARAVDQLAHSWDLLRATGQPTDIAPEMYATAEDLLRTRLGDGPRNPKLFADERDTSAGACPADRFAAFAGRAV